MDLLMSQRFEDIRVDREGRLTLGIDLTTGKRFLSISVGNAMVDYEEYYKLSDEEYREFVADPGKARAFAKACRDHAHDARLILEPGSDRGIPR